VIEGMKTTIPLHQALLDEPDFQTGAYSIKWLEEWLAREQTKEAVHEGDNLA
jgi:acetyl-CoA carboxylase biotin carboxylase subunit